MYFPCLAIYTSSVRMNEQVKHKPQALSKRRWGRTEIELQACLTLVLVLLWNGSSSGSREGKSFADAGRNATLFCCLKPVFFWLLDTQPMAHKLDPAPKRSSAAQGWHGVSEFKLAAEGPRSCSKGSTVEQSECRQVPDGGEKGEDLCPEATAGHKLQPMLAKGCQPMY